MNRTIKSLILVGILSIALSGCSKTSTQEKVTDEPKQETNNSNEVKNIEERPYLVEKYIEVSKGKSFEETKSIISKEGIEIKDSQEFDSPKGFKSREVSIIDGKNELKITFRDDKLSSKTFTYDKDDSKSDWFYSNYYDILDKDPEAGESHGIWLEGTKSIEYSDEYEMLIGIHDNIESK